MANPRKKPDDMVSSFEEQSLPRWMIHIPGAVMKYVNRAVAAKFTERGSVRVQRANECMAGRPWSTYYMAYQAARDEEEVTVGEGWQQASCAQRPLLLGKLKSISNKLKC
jgi:hypothetical protein